MDGWFWAALGVLVLVAGWLLLGRLSYPLVEPDEGRYAEVVREMVASRDWIIPRLHQVPFYDKPPLFYWLVAGSYRLFGVHEWAARLVPALAAFLTVLACFLLGRRLVGTRPAFLGTLTLALTVGFVQCGRIVILDSLLTLFVTVALLTAHEAIRGDRLRGAWWVASSISCALGMLTKGPIALVLLVVPVAGYAWLNGSKAGPRLRHWAVYGGLVVALAAPPYLALILRDPHFAYHFFIDQHLVRFFLQEYHVQPFWYYIPVLLITGLPASFLAVPLLRFLLDPSAQARAWRPRPLGFFVLWAGWCVLFFSVSSSKLPPYVLPAIPALALLAGWYLDLVLFQAAGSDVFQRVRTVLPRQVGIILAAIWLSGSIGGWYLHLLAPASALMHASLCVAALILLAWWHGQRPAQVPWLVTGALAALVSIGVAHQLVPAWSRLRSPLTRYKDWLAMARQARTPVACYEGEWGSVPFYLGGNDRVISLSGLSSEELFLALARQPRCVLIVRHKADLDKFRQSMAPYMQMTSVRYADEIGIGLLEAAPWWKKVLDNIGRSPQAGRT
jgi:dolichol-phosphate mannosyltransferase